MLENQKNRFWFLINIFIVALTLVLVFIIAPAIKRISTSGNSSPTLTVSAKGETVVIPDIAALTFSVVLEGADPKEIADKVNRRVKEAVDFLKSQDISKDDIKTTQYNLTPKYSYNRATGQSNIYAYELSQATSIKIRNFEKIASIMSGLTELGINRINRLNFTLDNPDEPLNKAREEAIKKAKENAKNIARNAGIKLGKIVDISEFNDNPYPPLYSGSFDLTRLEAAAPSVVSPQIEPGTDKISVSVNITYEIK